MSQEAKSAESYNTRESPQQLSPPYCVIAHEPNGIVLVGYIDSLAAWRPRGWSVQQSEGNIHVNSRLTAKYLVRGEKREPFSGVGRRRF
jgi:hypothetical protein